MKLPVYDKLGQAAGEFEFDDAWLGKFINYKLLHAAVRMYEANLRQGTVKTKNVREVVGKSAKPFKQKGTGRARMGRVRRFGSRGGATAFGPRPRDFSFDMPRHAKRLALRSALLGKFRDDEVTILDDLRLQSPKTKEVAATLKNLKIDSGCLIVIPEHDENTLKSCRNIPDADLSIFSNLNAYAVLRRKRLLFTKAALEALVREANKQ
ncbi:MAG: 50S ribosomal protein L4 [Planctomycetota bacterium]|jgi:large subunit ribosomal protein L4|nr:50S ribosomal protein L4 [Planctomycetota bacterium]